MEKKETLSIVIPVYNTDINLLFRCLKSIPDDDRLSIIICDDCSNKYNIKYELAKLFHDKSEISHLLNITKLHIEKKNIGLGAIRNKMIKLVKTNYIMFLDSDDEVVTDNVINALDIIENNNYNGNPTIDLLEFELLTICDGKSYNNSNNEFREIHNIIPYFTTPYLYNIKFLRKNELYYDESRRVFEDIKFSVRLSKLIMCNECNIVSSITPLYIYHLNGDSLTRTDSSKYMKLHDDLIYWIKWMKYYYKTLGESNRKIMKYPIFNRIRYESIKAMSFKLKSQGIYDEYDKYLYNMKHYNLDKILE